MGPHFLTALVFQVATQVALSESQDTCVEGDKHCEASEHTQVGTSLANSSVTTWSTYVFYAFVVCLGLWLWLNIKAEKVKISVVEKVWLFKRAVFKFEIENEADECQGQTYLYFRLNTKDKVDGQANRAIKRKGSDAISQILFRDATIEESKKCETKKQCPTWEEKIFSDSRKVERLISVKKEWLHPEQTQKNVANRPISESEKTATGEDPSEPEESNTTRYKIVIPAIYMKHILIDAVGNAEVAVMLDSTQPSLKGTNTESLHFEVRSCFVASSPLSVLVM